MTQKYTQISKDVTEFYVQEFTDFKDKLESLFKEKNYDHDQMLLFKAELSSALQFKMTCAMLSSQKD